MVFRHSNQFNYGEEIRAAIEREDVDPCRTISLAHIGPMLGGLSSTHFYASGRDEDFRADDQSGRTFSERVEDDAELQYPRALALTKDILNAIIAAGTEPEGLFVADKIWEDDSKYTTRLARLAQDTSLPVVIPRYHRPDQSTELKKFVPPIAPSVESYWKGRLAELNRKGRPVFSYPEETSPPTHQEILTALSELLPRGKESRGGYNYYGCLHTISEAPADKLQHWLLDPNSIVAEKLNYIVDYARLGKRGYIDYTSAASARCILAKINYQPGYNAMLQEIEDEADGIGSKETGCIPLSIYLQQDPLRVDALLETVKTTMGQPDPPSFRLYHPLYALLASGDPRVSTEVSSYLKIPAGATEEYGQCVVRPIIEALPHHLNLLRDNPGSTAHQQALKGVEKAVARLLNDIAKDKRRTLLKRSYLSDPIPKIADILMSFNNPGHHDVLRRTMLTYFAEQGSVIVSDRFARAYIKYRRTLGDIPEISQHITIRP